MKKVKTGLRIDDIVDALDEQRQNAIALRDELKATAEPHSMAMLTVCDLDCIIADLNQLFDNYNGENYPNARTMQQK